MRTWMVAGWLVGIGIGIGLAVAEPPAKAVEANTRGMKLYAKKDYAHAADEFRAAIKLDDTYVLARYNLASMAALMGDKPTVIEQLKWLHKSRDPMAMKVLAKAKTDPDLKSVVDDPDVKELIELVTPGDICMTEFADCGDACLKGRSCWAGCERKLAACNDGVGAGMATQADLDRMAAWLGTPLTGRDNDKASYRDATITRSENPDQTGSYSAYIKNEFEWTCTLAWSATGSPASLSACKSAQDKWTMRDPRVDLRCAVEKKPKMEVCRGAFVLLMDGGYPQDAEIVLRREIK